MQHVSCNQFQCNVHPSTYHDYVCNVNRHITQPCSICTTLCSNAIIHSPHAMCQTHMQCQVSHAFISTCLPHATLSMHSMPCLFHILLPCNSTMVQPMQNAITHMPTGIVYALPEHIPIGHVPVLTHTLLGLWATNPMEASHQSCAGLRPFTDGLHPNLLSVPLFPNPCHNSRKIINQHM